MLARWACLSVSAQFHDTYTHGASSQRIINEGGYNGKTLRGGRLVCSRLSGWKCRWRWKKQLYCTHKCSRSRRIFLCGWIFNHLLGSIIKYHRITYWITLYLKSKCFKTIYNTVHKATLKMSFFLPSLVGIELAGDVTLQQADLKRATGPLARLEPLGLQPAPESRRPVVSESSGKQSAFQQADSWRTAESFVKGSWFLSGWQKNTGGIFFFLSFFFLTSCTRLSLQTAVAAVCLKPKKKSS